MPYERSQALEQRLQELLGLIRGGQYSASSLATALAVSQPTVSRCLAALRKRGHKIRAVKDGHGWSFRLASDARGVSEMNGRQP